MCRRFIPAPSSTRPPDHVAAANAIRILGIDPGLRVTGFGILEKSGGKLVYVTSGCIKTASGELPVRLKTIIDGLAEVIGDNAPVQVAVLNITDAQADYVQDVVKKLKNQGFRVVFDLRNEKITYKIREHSMQKLPYILVMGDKEMAAGTVAVRARGNIDLGVMTLEAFSQKLASDIASKQ